MLKYVNFNLFSRSSDLVHLISPSHFTIFKFKTVVVYQKGTNFTAAGTVKELHFIPFTLTLIICKIKKENT